jgi:cytochrome c oxidase subunit 5b
MQGIDVFDMKPLDSSRKGTLQDPISVRSAGEEQYVGCCGVPADSHHQVWMVISRDRPYERCDECGNTIKMEYVGPTEDPHAHDHGYGEHAAHEPEKDIGHFIKEKYLREYGFIP